MSVWTINGYGLPDLDVETIVFNVQNQDEDYAEIRLPKNIDGSIPAIFAVGAAVVIKYGTATVFQGEIDSPSFHATPAAEYHSVFAYGPWHRFATMPFLYLYPYITGAELSTHGIIGGDANDILTTILETNSGDFFQVGTVEVGNLRIPETEVYDQTIAQTIQSILRYVPGAVVLFDYSTTPPTCHVLSDDSDALLPVGIDATSGRCSNLNLSPLYNRLVAGVTLQYEASGDLEAGEFSLYQPGSGTDVDTVSSPAASTGFFILGTDSSGDSTSRRHFRRTIRIEGAYDVSKYTLRGQLWPWQSLAPASSSFPFYNYNDLFRSAVAGTNRTNLNILIDRAMFFRQFPGNATNFSFNTSGQTKEPDNRPGAISFPEGDIFGDTGGLGENYGYYFRPAMRIGSTYTSRPNPITFSDYQSWWDYQNNPLPASLLKTATEDGIRGTWIKPHWDFIGINGSAGHNYAAGRVPFIDVRTIGTVDSTTGRFTHVKTVDNASATMPEAGIAAQILESNSRLLFDGGLTLLVDDNPGRFFGRFRRALVAPLGVTTIIQRFTLDVATGLADLTFGAPTHLGPQDLLSLYRAGKPVS
jgi:hypothetical protein